MDAFKKHIHDLQMFATRLDGLPFSCVQVQRAIGILKHYGTENAIEKWNKSEPTLDP